MRFLQLLLVASLVSIGMTVAWLTSTPSVQAELRTVDVATAAEAGDREGRANSETAVADPAVVTTTREEARDGADDGEASAAMEAAAEVTTAAAANDEEERHPVTLRGRVVDAESGEPLADVSVASAQIEVPEPTRTDSDGNFTIEGTTEDWTCVSFTVARTGFVPIRRRCELSDLEQGGADGLHFSLRRGCLVVGRVELPAKISASDVELSVVYEGVDDDEEILEIAWPLRRDGSFVIDSVISGTLIVLRARVGNHASGSTLPIRIPSTAGAVLHVDVPLIPRANCTIRLHSCDEWPGVSGDDPSFDPQDRVGLLRLDLGEEFRLDCGAEDDGSYRFSDVPAGRYEVNLNRSLGDEGVPLGSIELRPGDDRTFDLHKPPCLRVAGRFVPAQKIGLDRGCRPPDRVVLALTKPGTCLHTSVPGAGLRRIVAGEGDEPFSFPSVPPGRYALTANVDTEPLEVEAGDSSVIVREIGRGIVAGSVDVESDAHPVVMLTRGNGVTTAVACRPPGSSGDAPSFEFEGCGPGPLRLEVVASGHRLLERTIRTPRATERLELGTLQLEREFDLIGTLVDERDHPLAGVEVRAIRALPSEGWLPSSLDRWSIEPIPCTTDEAGRFQIPFAPKLAGFDLDLPDGEPVRVAAVVDGGKVTLRRPRLHAIRMTVVTEQGLPAHDVCVRLARSTDDSFGYRCFGEATTDARGRCTILTRASGPAVLTTSTLYLGLELDVEPFTIGEADVDLGTLVLRR